MKKLYLKQFKGSPNVYEVKKIINTVEWDFGERLDKEEVSRILKRVPKVEVIIQ
jgi:hypothetical protein